MRWKDSYSISILFSLCLFLVAIVIGNIELSYLTGIILIIVLFVIFNKVTSIDHSKSSPEKPFKLQYDTLNLDIKPPEEIYVSKEDKANEMRDNPTPAEKRMWEILTSLVTPNFPEHAFYSQSLQYGYILDFYCPSLKLAIEVDGGSHNNRRGYDWERDTHLTQWGIQVLRVNNAEVFSNSQDLADSLCKIIQDKNHHLRMTKRHSDNRYNKGRYNPRRY